MRHLLLIIVVLTVVLEFVVVVVVFAFACVCAVYLLPSCLEVGQSNVQQSKAVYYWTIVNGM